MKRKTKHKAKKISPAQRARARRACLAQSYYRRADVLEVTTLTLPNKKFRVIAEALPSTAHPNIMGVVDGTKQECKKYADTLRTIARQMSITYREVFVS